MSSVLSSGVEEFPFATMYMFSAGKTFIAASSAFPSIGADRYVGIRSAVLRALGSMFRCS
jgi:hypothetical protein